MLPTAEAGLAVEAVPTVFGAALRVGLTVALVAGAGWAWIAWLKRGRGTTRRLEVEERAFLTRGAGVALLRVDERRMLVGISAEGVRLISDLDEPAPGAPAAQFAGVLAEVTDREAAQ